jgi:hypothetical protein
MKQRINYLGFLSLLSLIGLIGFFNRDVSFVFTFFIFIGYASYFRIVPDELFKKRLMQSATISFFTLGGIMLGFYVLYLITSNPEVFVHGFWISFTLLTLLFPIIFTFFEIKDVTDL